MPIAYTLADYLLALTSVESRSLSMIYTILGFVLSGLVAISYALLLVAVFAGRAKPAVAWPKEEQAAAG